MKKIVLISAIAISGLFFNTANAQIRIHLGLNFTPRPVYVPERVVVREQPVEYVQPTNDDGDDDYFYIPEVDAYYSVPEQCYYYNDGGQWVSAEYLPGAYRDFDWRSARRYEVRAYRPFMHDDYYRTRYSGVTFNGHWDRGYDHGYSYANHFNHDQYDRNDQRFDRDGDKGNYSRQYDQNRGQHFDNGRGRNNQGNEQNHNFDRMGAQQHFAQNIPQRGGWAGRDDHRRGRF